jgi:catechol 2,3-dioxygenase-like lactoylglutathione lyase family enzyme
MAARPAWTTTEVGRQPWTVYGLLRTAESVTPSLTGADVTLSLVLYIAVYPNWRLYEPSTSRAEKLSDAAAGWIYRRIFPHRRRHRTIGSVLRKGFGGRVLSRGDSSGAPGYIQLANTWLIVNVGGGPTPEKPTVTLSVPNPDSFSSFMNICVANIQACYELWRSRGAQFITEPKDQYGETFCYMRDPDGYIIEVGQSMPGFAYG